MAKIDFEKEVLFYRNRFMREIVLDLVGRFGKDGILRVLRDINDNVEPKDIGNVFISIEDDGSEWVHREDFDNLRIAFLNANLTLEKVLNFYKSERTKSFLTAWLDGDERKANEIISQNLWIEMTSERLTEVLSIFSKYKEE